jgi:hypothetical protein
MCHFLGAVSAEVEVTGEKVHQVHPILSVTVSEDYDSNVMLQNEGAEAGQDSFVTSVLPVVGVRANGEGEIEYATSLKYAPDYTFFHDLSRESYLRHIGLFTLDVGYRGLDVKAGVKGLYTDGTTDPPVWGTTANGDQVPAQGVVEVRSRRRNMLFLSDFSARQQINRAFVRGVFDARIWDFMTDDTFAAGLVIQNYYDRSDINGGADLGLRIEKLGEPYVGYRYGQQEREFQPDAPLLNYANTYHRFFVGITTEVADWFRLRGEIGPSLHSFDPATLPVGVSSEQDYLYFKAAATFKVATNTLFEVTGGQHLLPAASGPAVFQNLVTSGTLRHRFSSRWKGSLGIEFIQYDFFPAFRRDQRFVPELVLEYAFSRHFSASAAYRYEAGINVLDVPNGDKRDYDRHVVGIGINATY